MDSLSKFLRVWRSVTVSEREFIEAVVLPEHRGPSPELRQALRDWAGSFYWADGADEGRLVLIRITAPARKEVFCGRMFPAYAGMNRRFFCRLIPH